MSFEEVVGRLKVMRRDFVAIKTEEEKHLLLTHEEWLARMNKNNAVDSFFFSSTRGHDSHNKENRGRGRGRGHGRGHGGREGRDNTS